MNLESVEHVIGRENFFKAKNFGNASYIKFYGTDIGQQISGWTCVPSDTNKLN